MNEKTAKKILSEFMENVIVKEGGSMKCLMDLILANEPKTEHCLRFSIQQSYLEYMKADSLLWFISICNFLFQTQ